MNEAGRDFCTFLLESMRLSEGDDFKIFNGMTVSRIGEAIIRGKRQLLIAGTFRGTPRGVDAFLDSLRGLNEELVCMGFTSSHLLPPGLFDIHVDKNGDDSGVKFSEAVRQFLDGRLLPRSHAPPPLS